MINVVIIGHDEGASIDVMLRSLPRDWKIVYVADRCTDGSVQELRALGVKTVDTTPLGLEGRHTSTCRNLGLSLCDKGADVLFLDGDRYPVKGDIRKAYEEMTTDVLCLPVEDDGRTPENFDVNYGRVFCGVFSCGMIMRRAAIEAVQRFQQGMLFNEQLQQYWGIEDTSLGDVCYHLGLTAALTNEVILRGGFDRFGVSGLDVIEQRLRFRDRLNVRWD